MGVMQPVDFNSIINRLKFKRFEKSLINCDVTFFGHNYSQSYPQIMWRVFSK